MFEDFLLEFNKGLGEDFIKFYLKENKFFDMDKINQEIKIKENDIENLKQQKQEAAAELIKQKQQEEAVKLENLKKDCFEKIVKVEENINKNTQSIENINEQVNAGLEQIEKYSQPFQFLIQFFCNSNNSQIVLPYHCPENLNNNSQIVLPYNGQKNIILNIQYIQEYFNNLLLNTIKFNEINKNYLAIKDKKNGSQENT